VFRRSLLKSRNASGLAFCVRSCHTACQKTPIAADGTFGEVRPNQAKGKINGVSATFPDSRMPSGPKCYSDPLLRVPSPPTDCRRSVALQHSRSPDLRCEGGEMLGIMAARSRPRYEPSGNPAFRSPIETCSASSGRLKAITGGAPLIVKNGSTRRSSAACTLASSSRPN